MKKKYFTLTGTRHYHGSDFIKPGMKVRLVKEPDNPYDKEAIRVEVKGVGKVGYVANSAHTVLGESLSAGRLYDHIGKKAQAKVVHKLDGGIICVIKKPHDKKKHKK